MSKEMYVLIGLPAAGKSTWRNQFLSDKDDFVVASSDDIIDRMCAEKGITYNDGFKDFIGPASSEFKAVLAGALRDKKSVIVDRTNMTVNGRKQYVQMARRAGYKLIAVDFRIAVEEAIKRMVVRAEKESKYIPLNIMYSMNESYKEPTIEEGFDEILVVQQ